MLIMWIKPTVEANAVEPVQQDQKLLLRAQCELYHVSTALWIIMNIRAVSHSTAIRAT